ALFVVDLYCSFYQAVFLDKIILHLYVAILIHAFIIMIMFALPVFKLFIYKYSAVSDLMLTHVGDYRVAGFSGGGSALLSFFQALGVGLSVYLVRFCNGNNLIIFVSNLVIVSSVLLTGRVGLILLVLF